MSKKSGTKTSKKTAKPKAKAKPAAAPKAETKAKVDSPRAVTGDNILTEDQQRALHFNHRKIYEDALALKKRADKAFKDACKVITSEGGVVEKIKTAILLDTPEGEAKVRADIEATLRIARFEGSDLGHQMQLLVDPPAVDRAFDEGKIAGLKALPKKPPHDPSVPQYKRWMEGYDEGQAVLSKKFKPLKPDDKPKGSEPPKATQTPPKAAQDAKAPPAAPPKPPATGTGPTASAGASQTPPKAPAPPPESNVVNLQQGGTSKPH